MRPLHCLLWHHERNKGFHTWTLNNKQNKLHWAYNERKKKTLAASLSKMTVCPAVSSQKAKCSARPRTEQANKVLTSCLTPALTGLWVGFCPHIDYFLQVAQWKGHIYWNAQSTGSMYLLTMTDRPQPGVANNSAWDVSNSSLSLKTTKKQNKTQKRTVHALLPFGPS